MQKYIGRRAINELRRMGIKTPNAYTYDRIIESIDNAIKNIQTQDQDVTIVKSEDYERLRSITDKRTQNKVMREIAKMHDDQHMTFKQIAMLLNNTDTSQQRKDKKDDLVNKQIAYAKDVAKDITRKYDYEESQILYDRIEGQSGIRDIKNIYQAVNSYPPVMRDMVIKQLRKHSDNWLIDKIEHATRKELDIVEYTTDVKMSAANEADILNFFDINFAEYTRRIKMHNDKQNIEKEEESFKWSSENTKKEKDDKTLDDLFDVFEQEYKVDTDYNYDDEGFGYGEF